MKTSPSQSEGDQCVPSSARQIACALQREGSVASASLPQRASTLDGFVLFGENCTYVGSIVSVALARHPRAGPATKLIIPNTIRVVFP